MFYCGIDPGSKGAMVVIDDEGNVEVFPFKQGMQQSIAFLRTNASACIAAVEDVHAFQGSGASSSFTFGKNLGYIHGMLETLMIGYIKVQSQVWQKTVTVSPVRMVAPKKLIVLKQMSPDKLKQVIQRNIEIDKQKALFKRENKAALKAESIRSANEHLPKLNTFDDNVADAANIAVYLRYAKRLPQI